MAELASNPGDDVKTTSGPGVLVIVGSFQSLGILRSLASHHIPTYLIDWDLCVGRFSRCTNRFSICPPVIEKKKFMDFLRDLAVKQNLEGWLIYANDDRTVEFLAKHKPLCRERFADRVREERRKWAEVFGGVRGRQ